MCFDKNNARIYAQIVDQYLHTTKLYTDKHPAKQAAKVDFIFLTFINNKC